MKPLATPAPALTTALSKVLSTAFATRRFAAAACALACVAAPLPAAAQASTGGLDGWTVLGDVVSVQGAITLTTAYLDGFSDEAQNLSGQSAVDVNLIEPAAGLAPYALDLDDTQFATEGSLVTQSFDVAAGDTLSFDWTFGGVEDLYLDHAFVAINGVPTTLATRHQPGAALNGFSLGFAGAGTVHLALGVVDTGDYLGVSTFSVSNLQVTAVPEPATVALLLAGLGLVGAAARRRRP